MPHPRSGILAAIDVTAMPGAVLTVLTCPVPGASHFMTLSFILPLPHCAWWRQEVVRQQRSAAQQQAGAVSKEAVAAVRLEGREHDDAKHCGAAVGLLRPHSEHAKVLLLCARQSRRERGAHLRRAAKEVGMLGAAAVAARCAACSPPACCSVRVSAPTIRAMSASTAIAA